MPDLPPIETYQFRGALDLVELARIDRSIGWKTWPEVWHLDDEGSFCCYYSASTLDSIQSWAADPSPLRRSRTEGQRNGGCADHWVVVDSRPRWLPGKENVNESDAEAFLRLRSELDGIGVHLLDVVVFDDQQHWWSLHELTSGTTTWAGSDRAG